MSDDDRRNDAQTGHSASTLRGLLLRRDGEPVGWVSVAPRHDYIRLPRTKVVADGTPDRDFSDPTIWAIVCFTVAPGHRRTGVARRLVNAAIEHATAGGATRIEAYPIDTDAQLARGRTLRSDDLNTGTLALFIAAGFVEVARPQPTRPIVQRRTTPTAGSAEPLA